MHVQENSKASLSQTAPLPTKGDSAYSADPVAVTSHSLAKVSRDAESHQIGDIVGNRYSLQSRVGPGRLGTVYEATDQQLMQASRSDYRVSIELFCLPSELAHLRTRFASEFVDLLSVSHPNIARIIDFGIDGETIFFTTELLEGTSLDSMLDGESTDSFSDKEILAVLRSVADALQYVHAKGLIHGELNSDSIFITTDYEVKIVDLAIEVLKRTLGNPDEQLAASSQKALKPTADVFGIAAVAYELLACERPYEGLPRGHARKRGLRLRRIKGVARNRWKALASALQLLPVDRTQTIAQFAADFGISGTESLQALEAGEHSKERRSLLPALLLVAITATAAMIQFEILNPTDMLSGFRERIGSSTPTVVIDSSVPEETYATEDDATGDDVAGGQLDEILPQSALATAGESASAEFGPADNPLPDLVLPAEQDLRAEEPATLDDAQIKETAVGVSAAPAEDVTGTTEIGASAQIDTTPVSAPPAIAFAQETVVVREGQDMAAVVLQRLGNAENGTPIIWWTGDNTAMADHDYADLGVRSETFETGVSAISLYVPLISDSLVEQRESFYVFVASDLAPDTVSDRVEIIVNDDDR
ncbi:MAG: protein kinase [Woeseiaceae bacterium]